MLGARRKALARAKICMAFSLFPGFLRILLAQAGALDLAGDGLGQLIHKFHDTRVFVGSGDMLDVVLQL